MKAKKLLSWLLVLCMVFSLLPAMSLTAAAVDNVKYIDTDGQEQTANGVTEITDASFTADGDKQVTLGTGWYVVQAGQVGTDDFPGRTKYINVTGNANLILADNANLDVRYVTGTGTLTVWGQTNGTGELEVRNDGDTISCATLIVNGGKVYAAVNTNNIGDGITSSTVTINGGTVTAYGRGYVSAGIGSASTTVTINGGAVNATGGGVYGSDGNGGPGIEATTLTINGGRVTANGGYSQDDRGGDGIEATTVTINGGMVTANGGEGGSGNGTPISGTVNKAPGATDTTEGDTRTITVPPPTVGDLVAEPTDANGEKLAEVPEADKNIVPTAVPTTGSTVTWGSSEGETWYVVSGTKTITGNVTLAGDVHLILCDDAILTVNGGIITNRVDNAAAYSLTVWGQAEGTGKLTANGTEKSNFGIFAKNLTVNGGEVEAIGAETKQGILLNISIGEFTVNGGKVTGTASNTTSSSHSGAAGITAQNITVHGGTVIANGGSNPNYYAGAGINAGNNAGTVTVTGGTVIATAGTAKEGLGVPPSSIGGSTFNISNDLVVMTGNAAPGEKKDAPYSLNQTFYSIKYAYIGPKPAGAYDLVIPSVTPAVTLPESAWTTVPTKVTSSDTEWGAPANDTWYVVDGNVDISGGVTLRGNVNLILTNGATLNVQKILSELSTASGSPAKYSLTIWQQTPEQGKEIGKLVASTSAASTYPIRVKNLIVNGGKVEANSSVSGTFGMSIFAYGITINGGDVTATATNGSAIYLKEGSITVNGGKVSTTSTKAAGISFGLANGVLTVNGGTVIASGSPAVNTRTNNITAGTGVVVVAGDDAGTAQKVESYNKEKYVIVTDGPLFDLRDGNGLKVPGADFDYTATPTWKTYYFNGWYTGIDGMGTPLGDGTPAAGTTYYAKWTKNGQLVITQPVVVSDDGVKIGSAAATKDSWALYPYGLEFTDAAGDQPASLTMTYVNIDNSIGEGNFTAIDITVDNLVIELTGTNKVTISGDAGEESTVYGIKSVGSVQLTGDGSLTVDESNVVCEDSDGVSISGGLTIDEDVSMSVVIGDEGTFLGLHAGDTLTVKGALAANGVVGATNLCFTGNGTLTLTGAKDDTITAGSIKLLNDAGTEVAGAVPTVSGGTGGFDETESVYIYTKTATATDMVICFAPMFDLRDGNGVQAAGESFDYNAPVWADRDYTFAGWSENIDDITYVSKGGNNTYDAADFENGKTYYAVWKNAAGHVVVTQNVEVYNIGGSKAVYIGGKIVVVNPDSGYYYLGWSQVSSNYGFDNADGRINMTNATIDVAADPESYTSAFAFYMPSELKLTGDNSIIVYGNTNNIANALYVHTDCTLTVTGEGTLNADASKAVASLASNKFIYGANLYGALTVGENVTMTAAGGNGYYSFGLYSEKALTVDGTATGIGGTAASGAYGVYCYGDAMTVNGTVTGIGGTANTSASGVSCFGDAMTVNGTVNGIGGTAQYANGVNCTAPLTVNGTVNATGGNGTGEYYGIWTAEDVTVNEGGKLNLYACPEEGANKGAMYLESTEKTLTVNGAVTADSSIKLDNALTLGTTGSITMTGAEGDTLTASSVNGTNYNVTGRKADETGTTFTKGAADTNMVLSCAALFDLRDGSGAQAAGESFNYTAPTWEGRDYTFAGWSENIDDITYVSKGENETYDATDFTNGKTYYAVWKNAAGHIVLTQYVQVNEYGSLFIGDVYSADADLSVYGLTVTNDEFSKLSINNVTIDTQLDAGGTAGLALFPDCELNVTGNNSVIQFGSADSFVKPIYSANYKTLTVTGNGVLNVDGTNTTANNSNNYGIYIGGAFTLGKDVTVNTKSGEGNGDGKNSYGIVISADATINGTLNATGGKATHAHGVFCSGTLTINEGGVLNGFGYAESETTNANGVVSAGPLVVNGTLNATGGNATTNYHGLQARNNVTVGTNGKLNLRACPADGANKGAMLLKERDKETTDKTFTIEGNGVVTADADVVNTGAYAAEYKVVGGSVDKTSTDVGAAALELAEGSSLMTINPPAKPVYGGSSSNTITAPASVENGKVSVDKTKASSGETVTITVTPDKGYTLDTLTVKDANGKAVELTKVNNTTYTFKMPNGKVDVNATFKKADMKFVDVAGGTYYYDAVQWAIENGITDGTDDTHFSPNAITTRAQVVTFLWRAAGCPEPKSMTSFGDVSANSYYEKAVAWAVENGITDGVGNDLFAPDQVCTRAQIVTFLYRYNAKDTMNIKVNPFTDIAEGAYFYDAVLWASETGVTSGTSDITFSPANNCTRGQTVTFLYRLLAK